MESLAHVTHSKSVPCSWIAISQKNCTVCPQESLDKREKEVRKMHIDSLDRMDGLYQTFTKGDFGRKGVSFRLAFEGFQPLKVRDQRELGSPFALKGLKPLAHLSGLQALFRFTHSKNIPHPRLLFFSTPKCLFQDRAIGPSCFRSRQVFFSTSSFYSAPR